MFSSIDVCVCTFRRPQLAATLASLAGQRLPAGATVRVIIADNDETPSAQSLVEEIGRDFPFPIRYVHAPARNISIARNACLTASDAPLTAFIDDDECAPPDWLAGLLARQAETGAGAVLGPVRALYPDTAPRWQREGDFHSIRPVWVDGAIITGYTSNVLLSRGDAAWRGLSFDLAFGRTGGEDTTFFKAFHEAGGRIEFAPEALLTEIVAPGRMSLSWLVKRSFRSGQTHGVLLAMGAAGQGQLFSRALVASGKAAFCGAMAVLSLFSRRRAARWLLRGSLHVGVVMRLFGVRELVQYG